MKRLIVTPLVLYAIFSILKDYILIEHFRIFLIPIAISFVVFLGNYAKIFILHDVRKYTKIEKRKKKEFENQKKKDENLDFLEIYDKEVKPLYWKGRCLFSKLIKTRKLRSYEIRDLKKLISGRLGDFDKYYHNFKFKNDANEIYVKMKNFNLNKDDWTAILEYLADKETNEPLKKEEE